MWRFETCHGFVGVSATQQEGYKKKGSLEEEEKNHSTLKTNLLRDPAAAA